jgi:hypothetical protein
MNSIVEASWLGLPRRVRPVVALLMLTVLFLTSFFRFYEMRAKKDYDTDETGWIRASMTIAKVILAADLRPSSWEFQDQGAYGNLNPTLGKLFFSMPFVAMGLAGKPLPEPPTRWDHSKSFEYNYERGTRGAPEVLHPLRAVAAVFGAALVVLCSVIVLRIAGPLAGAACGILLMRNYVFAQVSSAVLTDVFYTFFLLATLAIPLFVLRRRQIWKPSYSAAALGLALGMATAVKYSALLLLLPYLAFLALAAWWTGKLRLRQLAMACGISGVCVASVVYGTNPFLWPVPHKPSDILRDIRHIKGTTKGLAHLPGELSAKQTPDGWQPREVIPALYGVTRPAQFPLAYLRWKKYAAFQRSQPHWKPPVNKVFFGRIATSRYSLQKNEPYYVLLGIGVALALCRKRAQAGIFLAYALIAFVMIFLTRLADIDRYLFQLYVLRAMFSSVGIGFVLALIAAGLGWAILRLKTLAAPPVPPAESERSH